MIKKNILYLFLLLIVLSCGEQTEKEPYPASVPDFFCEYLESSAFIYRKDPGIGYHDYAVSEGIPAFMEDTVFLQVDSTHNPHQISSFYHFGLLCELYKLNLTGDEEEEYLGVIYPFPMMGTLNMCIFSGDSEKNVFLDTRDVKARNWSSIAFEEIRKEGTYDVVATWDQRSIVMYNSGVELYGMQGKHLKKMFEATELLEYDYPGNKYEEILAQDEAIRELRVVEYHSREAEPYILVRYKEDKVNAVGFMPEGKQREYEVLQALESSEELYYWNEEAFEYQLRK